MDKTKTHPNLSDVAARAEESFWQSVAESYPDIRTGDIAPDVSIYFTRHVEEVIAAWVEANRR